MVVSENRLSVQQGEEFEIRLIAALSTGYKWDIVACPAEIVTVPGQDALSTGEHHRVGDAGVQIFRFKATASGTYTITFVLKRPWEKRALERRTFQVEVTHMVNPKQPRQ